MGFVGGEEYLVGVFQAKGPQIDGNAMLVRHGESDAVDRGARLDGCGSHGIEGLLRGEALVGRESFEQRLADPRPRSVPVGGTGPVQPVGLEYCGQNAVCGVGQRGVAVRRKKPVKAEPEDLRRNSSSMPDSTRGPPRNPGRCTFAFRAEPAKRVWVCVAVDFDPLKGLLDDVDCRPFDVAMMLEKVVSDRAAEIFDRFQGMLLGQRVRHVFHRVGGYDQAVVATGVRTGEVPFELDLDRQLADFVAVRQTRDLGDTNPRLAVGMLRKDGRHDRTPQNARPGCCHHERS